MSNWTGPTISYKYSEGAEPLLIPIILSDEPHEDTVTAFTKAYKRAIEFCETIPFEDLPKYIHHENVTIKFMVTHKLIGIEFPRSDDIKLRNWYDT